MKLALELFTDAYERMLVRPFLYPGGLDDPGYFAACAQLGRTPFHPASDDMAVLLPIDDRNALELFVEQYEGDILKKFGEHWATWEYVEACGRLGREPLYHPRPDRLESARESIEGYMAKKQAQEADSVEADPDA